MIFRVVRCYDHGRRISDKELRHAPGVIGDVRMHQEGQFLSDKPSVHAATCSDGGVNKLLPDLLEPRVTGFSPLAFGLEGFEEHETPHGIVYYRQAWWCRER